MQFSLPLLFTLFITTSETGSCSLHTTWHIWF